MAKKASLARSRPKSAPEPLPRGSLNRIAAWLSRWSRLMRLILNLGLTLIWGVFTTLAVYGIDFQFQFTPQYVEVSQRFLYLSPLVILGVAGVSYLIGWWQLIGFGPSLRTIRRSGVLWIALGLGLAGFTLFAAVQSWMTALSPP